MGGHLEVLPRTWWEKEEGAGNAVSTKTRSFPRWFRALCSARPALVSERARGARGEESGSRSHNGRQPLLCRAGASPPWPRARPAPPLAAPAAGAGTCPKGSPRSALAQALLTAPPRPREAPGERPGHLRHHPARRNRIASPPCDAEETGRANGRSGSTRRFQPARGHAPQHVSSPLLPLAVGPERLPTGRKGEGSEQSRPRAITSAQGGLAPGGGALELLVCCAPRCRARACAAACGAWLV